MPEGLKVSLESLIESATEIKRRTENIQFILNETTVVMNSVPDIFKSDAATAFLDKYNSLTKRYEAFKTQMETYGSFLVSTAEKYGGTDEEIAKLAQQYLAE